MLRSTKELWFASTLVVAVFAACAPIRRSDMACQCVWTAPNDGMERRVAGLLAPAAAADMSEPRALEPRSAESPAAGATRVVVPRAPAAGSPAASTAVASIATSGSVAPRAAGEVAYAAAASSARSSPEPISMDEMMRRISEGGAPPGLAAAAMPAASRPVPVVLPEEVLAAREFLARSCGSSPAGGAELTRTRGGVATATRGEGEGLVSGRRDGCAESTDWVVEQIGKLLDVPAYLSRRELRVRKIQLTNEELSQSRHSALRARALWLEIDGRMRRDPALRKSVIERMGESGFNVATHAIEERFKQLEAAEPRNGTGRAWQSFLNVLPGMH